MIQLTEEQHAARLAILEGVRNDYEDVLSLVGPAGVGKSTLMGQVLEDLEAIGRTVRLAAPTGKAAYVLSEKTGREASTLHSLLYGEVRQVPQYEKEIDWALLEISDEAAELLAEAQEEDIRYVMADDGTWWDSLELQPVKAPPTRNQPFHAPTAPPPVDKLSFGAPKFDIHPTDVVVVDESSMVSIELHRELMDQVPQGAKVLYVGDKEQLSPVNSTWGADFSDPTAELRTVHRQAADRPIIQAVTKIRLDGVIERTPAPPDFERKRMTSTGIGKWCADLVKQGEDVILLVYGRKMRAVLNKRVRAHLGMEAPVEVGDRLKVAKNSREKGVVNGELVYVEKVQEYDANDRGELVLTLRDAQGAPMVAIAQPKLFGEEQGAFNAYLRSNKIWRGQAEAYLHFDYGYASTVHSAQGSEFDHVGFVADRILQWVKKNKGKEEYRRVAYTACTRAVKHLVVFDHG